MSTAEVTGVPYDVASVKAELKLYGPMCMDISAGDLNCKTLCSDGCNHAVVGRPG